MHDDVILLPITNVSVRSQLTVSCPMPGPSSTPPPKRIKLESASPKADNDDDFGFEPDTEVDEDHCTICLQSIADRAVIPACSHEFCFECLMIWSRKSPFSSLHAYTILLN